MLRVYSLVLCLTLLPISLQHKHHHRCIHEELAQRYPNMMPIDDRPVGRLLQSTPETVGPIRIKIIFDTNSVTKDDVIGSNIIKIMEIVRLFYERVIEIKYRDVLPFNVLPGTDVNNYNCLNFHVPSVYLTNPTTDADIGIFVRGLDDGGNQVTAFAYPCAYSITQGRPLWALVHWNKFYMSFDQMSFQQNVRIGIHEVLHILGFSSLLYGEFKYGYKVDVNGYSYLAGKFIKQAVIEQFNCKDVPGMLLESLGGTGTRQSHWSAKAFDNQIMTAGVPYSSATISYVTLALLEETGWYTRISKEYGSFVNYSYRKGCNNLDPNMCDIQEACKDVDVKQCNFDGNALGYCKITALSPCLYVKAYENFICSDPNFAAGQLQKPFIANTGEVGSYISKCYNSNLVLQQQVNTKYAFRCYETICSKSRMLLTIRVHDKFLSCMFPGQILTLAGYDGTLSCPLSFANVCGLRLCPLACNSNGICVNGRCLCHPSYTGPSCSEVKSVADASKIINTLASNNNNCAVGTFLNVFGECQLCPTKCASCNENGCIVCMNGSLPTQSGCTTS